MAQTTATAEPRPALKEIFNDAAFREIATHTTAIFPAFDQHAFLSHCRKGLEELSLTARLRRITEALHETLPTDFPAALAVLRELAPRLESGFGTLFLPDYVALHGERHFDLSMAALEYFTSFGSAEFAIRHFLKRDFERTLHVMRGWSEHASDHVRRLSSEGSRPLLPWAFRVDGLLASPPPTSDILDRLRSDSSKYVRISVANHLNDIAKSDPDWVIDRFGLWGLKDPNSAWIARHGLRTLVKSGDRRALALLGAGAEPLVTAGPLILAPAVANVGGSVRFALTLRSTSQQIQHLIIDYTVYYAKKSGKAFPKTFKLKELDLKAGEVLTLSRKITLHDLTTRTHHPGMHRVVITANGAPIANAHFMLQPA
uniref:DNA alkylation repair enzyme-like protein n=2 Tax=Sphingomonas sp. JE1 TaxID=1628059 RepID=A0A0D5A096_9SPHN|nr:DNA alkylation repair enzyme-like protein [Sphingomonas sp. JE1]